jgi:hypothetical protein
MPSDLTSQNETLPWLSHGPGFCPTKKFGIGSKTPLRLFPTSTIAEACIHVFERCAVILRALCTVAMP